MNSLDLGPSQTTSTVKTYAKKSPSFSAMSLLSLSAAYKPLTRCGTVVSLDGFLLFFKQLFTISMMIFCKIFAFLFSQPSLPFTPDLFLIGSPVHFSNFLNANIFPCNSLLSFIYELCRVFTELFYFLFDM